jgi:dipeptidyl aminopeptidase/acylaminoacyl peptidase
VLTRRESALAPPNAFLRDLAGGEPRQLTFFPHPYPALAGVRPELIRYRRADGTPLFARLYLPPGFKPGDPPPPMLMWAYPREFLSEEAAGQVYGSPNRFLDRVPFGPLPLLLEGYAVLDGPTMPIIGRNGAEPNDTYLEQLVMDAEAAVEEVVRRGVADRNRIAIGGHSYGAFTVANLLAHTKLFRAGIAQSGAYNRTLTPFGFQSEDRDLWEARDTYLRMSALLHADAIKAPLLLVHGQADNNPGTDPLQSERLYQAIKGLGGSARLVLLPLESHGYFARESIGHVQWEIARWLRMAFDASR